MRLEYILPTDIKHYRSTTTSFKRCLKLFYLTGAKHTCLPLNSTYAGFTLTESTAHAQVIQKSTKWKIFLLTLLAERFQT